MLIKLKKKFTLKLRLNLINLDIKKNDKLYLVCFYESEFLLVMINKITNNQDFNFNDKL